MQSFSTFIPPERTLMGPGPSDVNPRILNAMARPTLGHLDPLFIELMDQTKQLLQYAFKTENALTMPISAPGSAGMEAHEQEELLQVINLETFYSSVCIKPKFQINLIQ